LSRAREVAWKRETRSKAPLHAAVEVPRIQPQPPRFCGSRQLDPNVASNQAAACKTLQSTAKERSHSSARRHVRLIRPSAQEPTELTSPIARSSAVTSPKPRRSEMIISWHLERSTRESYSKDLLAGFGGRTARVHDSRRLGAAIPSSGFFADARSTATTGAWPSPTSTAVAGSGSKKAIIAPSGGPLKMAVLQGKKPAGSEVQTLWGQQWTRLPARRPDTRCRERGGRRRRERVRGRATLSRLRRLGARGRTVTRPEGPAGSDPNLVPRWSPSFWRRRLE
jgi:hypothetical protein